MAEQTYTATEIATFIAAIGVLITGIGAVIVNIIVALKQGRKSDEIIKAVAGVDTEAKIISGHVNSAASEAKAKITALEAKVEMMAKTATDIKEAVLLNTPVPRQDQRKSDDAGEILEKIEINTAAIDENTKVLTDDVENLKAKDRKRKI